MIAARQVGSNKFALQSNSELFDPTLTRRPTYRKGAKLHAV